MALYEPILPARYLVPLVDVVAQMRKSDRRKMPALAVLDHMDAASSTAVLPLDQVERLLEEISQLTGRQDLGFEIGRRPAPRYLARNARSRASQKVSA